VGFVLSAITSQQNTSITSFVTIKALSLKAKSMRTRYYSKLVVGVKLSLILEEVSSSTTKYNPNTGEPYQTPARTYKILGETVSYIPENKSLDIIEAKRLFTFLIDLADHNFNFHSDRGTFDILKYIQTGNLESKEQVVSDSETFDILKYIQTRNLESKEQVVFGIVVQNSDLGNNLQPVDPVEIEAAKNQVIELLRPHHPDLEPMLYLILVTLPRQACAVTWASKVASRNSCFIA
jgi:hypothetical protein